MERVGVTGIDGQRSCAADLRVEQPPGRHMGESRLAKRGVGICEAGEIGIVGRDQDMFCAEPRAGFETTSSKGV